MHILCKACFNLVAYGELDSYSCSTMRVLISLNFGRRISMVPSNAHHPIILDNKLAFPEISITRSTPRIRST